MTFKRTTSFDIISLLDSTAVDYHHALKPQFIRAICFVILIANNNNQTKVLSLTIASFK